MQLLIYNICQAVLFYLYSILKHLCFTGKTLSESYKDTHMALHTGDSVTCAVCNRKFDSADSLTMHAAVHTEIALSPSPTPPTSISTSLARETAVTTTTTATTIAMTSTTTTTTTATVETSDSQKPYQCQHCGRRFTRPHEKVKHERIHTGEKPHACEVDAYNRIIGYCAKYCPKAQMHSSRF